jgi:tetratricopeptide (TPR) repeat protein
MFGLWRFMQAIAVASVMSQLALSAIGSSASEYDAGLVAYKAHNYRLAAQAFQKSVAAGNSSAIVLLYIGHACLGDGDKVHAIEAYRKLADKYPSSAEAQLAIQCLLRLDPSLAGKYHLAPVPQVQAPTSVSSAVPADPKKAPFIGRIIIVPPAMGHPAVSQAMISTVRGIVAKLPSHMYKYLDEGGATINLAPNIEDKWPGSGDGKKVTVADGTMGEEPGRTYGRDVHIYEREKVRGANTLKDARSQSEIAHTCYHELGHAIDDIAGVLSNTPKFKELLQQDLSRMPEDIKSRYSYYTVPMEACAETVGVLLGGPSDNEVVQNMPMVRNFLKDKFHL